MTRFARAEGSKGANRPQAEEATPWVEMISQLVSDVRKNPMFVNEADLGIEGDALKSSKNVALPSQEYHDDDKEMVFVENDISDKKILKKKWRKKKKLGGEKSSNGAGKDLGYIVDESGQRVKVFKNGERKTWFDLPYEDGEVATRFENLWVKREDAEKLEVLRNELTESGLDSNTIKKKMWKAKRKAHNKLRLELIREQISSVETETGEVPSKKKKHDQKNTSERGSNNLTTGGKDSSQEDTALAEQVLEEVSRKKRRRKKKANNIEIAKEIMPNGNEPENEMELSSIVAENRKRKFDTSECPESPCKKLKPEESSLMTKYENTNYWVRKCYLPTLLSKKESYIKTQLGSSTDSNSCALNKEQQDELNKYMKKLLQVERKRIKQHLLKIKNRQNGENAMGKSKKKKKKTTKNSNNDISKISSSKNISSLNSEGEITDSEKQTMKGGSKTVCFNCQKTGHIVSNCPLLPTLEAQKCYKCGSTEHTAKDCKNRSKGDAYNYATCFICKETGHIARQCPDNPRGIYPYGGGCKLCGSVEHFRRDCPQLKATKKDAVNRQDRQVGVINAENLEGLGEN